MKSFAPIPFSNTNHPLLLSYKKAIVPFIFILLFSNGFSQDLYVDNDSFLYAKDVVVFVNDDIRLETATSNLYFRGDAQLIQNTDNKNSDAGELSIYQNQTTGIYEYNFWSSPVGESEDSTTQANMAFNGANAIHDPQDHTDLTNVNSSAYNFISGYDGTVTALSNYWMYTLIDAEGYYGWNQILHTADANPGYGFTLKGSPNLNNVLDFRGRPNNGDILVSCVFDGTDDEPNSGLSIQAETLTGNPYPSALDLKLFLINTNNQSVLNGEIFFWEQKQKNSHYLADYEGGYAIYTPGDPGNLSDNGTYVPATFENYDTYGGTLGSTTGTTTDFSLNNSRRFAAVGQGFVISSIANGGAPAGGNAIFTNDMRLYLAEDSAINGNGSVFAKTSNTKITNEETNGAKAMSHNGIDYKNIISTPTIIPEIRIHTHIDNTFYKENLIAFRESTPNNNTYNRFFDGKNTAQSLTADVYLLSDDNELSIKSINYDINTIIPFGFKTKETESLYKVSVYKLSNVPDYVNVFVYDKENNTYSDIKNGDFEISLPKGSYNNRFEITFNNQNSLSTAEESINNLKVFQNNDISELNILNPDNLEINSLSLFDVSGKRMAKKTISSNTKKYTYNTKELSSGVYITKITLKNGQSINNKVIVNN